MKNTLEKKLQLILLFWLIIPLAIMTFSFFFSIKISTERLFADTLFRFNENISIDSVNIPVSDINQSLVSISIILSEDKNIDDFLSLESSVTFQKIASIVNTHLYLDNIIVVKDINGHYKTYPEHISSNDDFKPKQRPWYVLNSSGNVFYSEPYKNNNSRHGVINNANDLVVSVSLPIINKEQRILAVVASDLNLKKLSDSLNNKIAPFGIKFFISSKNGYVINSSNSTEILEKEVPAEWINKAIKSNGSFYDVDGFFVFYKTYSDPDWIVFSYIDKYNLGVYFEQSFYIFYMASFICVVAFLIMFLLYNTYNKHLVGKLYLELYGADIHSQPLNLNSLGNEIVKQRVKFEQIKHDASVDELTHLYNRKKFEEDVLILMSKEQHFCLAVIDLDHFKSINDTFGHLVGDDVLRYVAREGTRLLGNDNLAYRFGGEEFIVLFPEKDLDTCFSLLNVWLLNVSEREWREPTLKVSFSGGLTMWHKGEDLDTLISRADEFLYKAKESGRGVIISKT